MTKPSLFPKRRALQRRSNAKREPKLDKVFDCLSCYHTKSIICKLDFERRAGTLICEICPARYCCLINHLSKEVDVYSEWVDHIESSKQLAQPKQRPQATTTTIVAPTPAAATQPQALEPWVRTKTPSLLKATPRLSRDQSRSPIPRDEAMAHALAPVHDRPNREQSHSPLPFPSPQAQTPVHSPVQVQAQPQSQSKALSVSPYHDQNEDNAPHLFQQGGMAPAPAGRTATGHSWVQGNNHQLGYNDQQGHAFNNRSQHRNNNQSFGSNHGYDFQIQDYGFISQGGFGGAHQGHGNNHGLTGNQGYGNHNNQGFNNSNNNTNQGYGNNQGGYGTQSNYNHPNHNDMFSSSSSGYYCSSNGGGEYFNEYDAYSPAGSNGGSPYDYSTGSSGLQYNTTGGYSDH
ncbi:transcription elongation factor Elf1 like-domain-containing protein [Linnemannia elongata]|nr:transcription elongation factor Elf1 like-domain-containing protein [Linnemannia elongata]